MKATTKKPVGRPRIDKKKTGKIEWVPVELLDWFYIEKARVLSDRIDAKIVLPNAKQ